MLFGGCVHPFFPGADESKIIPVHENTSVGLRCVACGGYWFPSCTWRGKSSWICALCGFESLMLEAKPKGEELREFAVVYQDECEGGEIVLYFLLDGSGAEEAFLDCAIQAASAAASSLELPSSVRFGLAVVFSDALRVVEFAGDDFLVTTARLKQVDFVWLIAYTHV
jgi:hypothetical protein